MTEIKLPWPSSVLSPNTRVHWARLARAKKQYRLACWAAALEQKATVPEQGQLRVELEFYRQARRAMDHDNLLSRMKAGLDGVADALKINDNRFTPISVCIAESIGGFVMMRIYYGEQQ